MYSIFIAQCCQGLRFDVSWYVSNELLARLFGGIYNYKMDIETLLFYHTHTFDVWLDCPNVCTFCCMSNSSNFHCQMNYNSNLNLEDKHYTLKIITDLLV